MKTNDRDLISVDEFRKMFKDYSIKEQDRVLDLFLKCGAKLQYSNAEEELKLDF